MRGTRQDPDNVGRHWWNGKIQRAAAKSDSGNSNMDGHLLSISAKWLDNNEGTMKVTTFAS